MYMYIAITKYSSFSIHLVDVVLKVVAGVSVCESVTPLTVSLAHQSNNT